MPNDIPARQRVMVQARDNLRCARCMAHCPIQGHWHHRRSRSVRDTHCHCTCNGVWLCVTCHTWVHAYPLLARQSGFIVSRHQQDPSTVPIQTPLGMRYLDCTGGSKVED